MAEAIHCPSCTTRYRLRPERLKPAFRRARCFTCGNVFPVGDVVQRLLTPPSPATTARFMLDLVDLVQHEPVEHAVEPAPSPTLNALVKTDPEIQEETLVAAPDSLPEAKLDVASPYPPEITETTLSGYSSARDAIEKLFDGTPLAGSVQKANPEPTSMDMEATLSALENTLGASPTAFATGSEKTLGGIPMPPKSSGGDLAGPSSSTVHLSREDLLAAIAPRPAPEPVPAPTSAPAEPTVPLRASDLLATRPTAPRSFTPFPESPDTGAEMLRLNTGEEIYGGLSMPQLISWVEEGRILENHLVARQHSENWLEAHKVPGLRPVFERLRRERGSAAPDPESGISEPAPKKSLFSGLFRKN